MYHHLNTIPSQTNNLHSSIPCKSTTTMTNTQFGEECDIVAVLTPKPGKLDRVGYPPRWPQGPILLHCASRTY